MLFQSFEPQEKKYQLNKSTMLLVIRNLRISLIWAILLFVFFGELQSQASSIKSISLKETASTSGMGFMGASAVGLPVPCSS